MSTQLRLNRPPPDRGPLLSPSEVGELLGRSAQWVRRHVPGKIRLGYNTIRWYEGDLRTWLEQQREEET